MKRPALALLAVAALARADAGDIRWDGSLYAYLETLRWRDDSVLNPGNRIAGLPARNAVAEARFNLKAEGEDVRLSLRPILVARSQEAAGDRRGDAYLSQWQARLRLNEGWNLAGGREVLNWGPAQLRSPASPFYYDNGRGNPLRELSGIDVVKVSWTPDLGNAATLAHIVGNGHDARGITDSWLLTLERRADEWAAGVVLARTPGQGPFLGTHARYTYSDALLLYGEAATSTRADALQSPADGNLPFALPARSPRRTRALAGAAYTFENGQSVNAEYLHDGHGYDAAGEAAYFSRAAVSPQWAGLALRYAPPLLGRRYLHLVWQSNLMESGRYWRLMATHGLAGHGTEISAYGEYAVDARTSLFAMISLPAGAAGREFSDLYRRSTTVGVKIAVP